MPSLTARRLAAASVAVASCAVAPVAHADVMDACVAAAEASQHHRRAGRLRAARTELLACAREACPVAVRSDCKRWLGEVETATPTVVFRAIGAAGEDVADVRVLIDGVAVLDRLDGRPHVLDPGAHVVRWVTPRGAIEQRIVLAQGERDRLVSVTLAAEAGAPRIAAPAADVRAPRTGVPVATLILGGVGLAGVVTGAVLWAAGRGERSALYATCGQTQSCAQSDVDDAQRTILFGDVAFGAGVVALATAAAWWALSPRSDSALAARPIAGGAWLGYTSRF